MKVKTRGYWFSAGGEKGSFGYYPHLKDSSGLPIYPDTQIKGDLKMAAMWLASLEPKYKKLLDIFGTGGDPEHRKEAYPSRIMPGDLRLTPESAEIWKKEPGRFEIKSRIQINDETRTVNKHFLVDLELARMDGLELEAPVFLVVPDDKKDELMDFLREITKLLSGFGAFRSRGYGRGDISLTSMEEVDKKPAVKRTGSRFKISLKALLNVRNKPVDPGSAQVLFTASAITPSQVKAWLASAYYDSYNAWPAPSLLACLELSPLFPSPSKDILAWPAPGTTLMDEEGNIKDQWGETLEERSQNENFFSGKTKPLGASFTVTEDLRPWPVRPEKRFRNSTDSSFMTLKEGGLFVQELLPEGTVFTGTLTLNVRKTKDNSGVRKLLDLLQTKIPNIKGSLFRAGLMEFCSPPGHADQKPGLAVKEIAFNPEMQSPENRIMLGTCRRYNVTLKRPRRARAVVEPGSVLPKGHPGTFPWQGFGEAIKGPGSGSGGSANGENAPVAPASRIVLTEGQKQMTRAQAGILRNFLHPAITEEAITKELEHRIEKYEGKPNLREQKNLLTALLEILKDKGIGEFRDTLEDVLKQLKLASWEKRNRGAA